MDLHSFAFDCSTAFGNKNLSVGSPGLNYVLKDYAFPKQFIECVCSMTFGPLWRRAGKIPSPPADLIKGLNLCSAYSIFYHEMICLANRQSSRADLEGPGCRHNHFWRCSQESALQEVRTSPPPIQYNHPMTTAVCLLDWLVLSLLLLCILDASMLLQFHCRTPSSRPIWPL